MLRDIISLLKIHRPTGQATSQRRQYLIIFSISPLSGSLAFKASSMSFPICMLHEDLLNLPLRPGNFSIPISSGENTW